MATKLLISLVVLCSLCGISQSQLDQNDEQIILNPDSLNLVDIFLSELNNLNASESVEVDARSQKGGFNNLQCMLQLKKLSKVKETKDMNLIKMIDSWGKIPSGILRGHFMNLGHFDECIDISANYGSLVGQMKGQYCLASIKVPKMKQSFENIDLTSNMGFTPVERAASPFSPSLRVGICFPSVCDPAFVNTLFQKYFSLQPHKCSVKERASFEPVDIVAITLFSIIAAIMLASSIYEYVTKKLNVTPQPLFVAFSVITNTKKLSQISTKKSPNSIDCLNGIRVFSMVWVIFGHTFVWFAGGALMNMADIVPWYRTVFSTMLVNSTVSVDSFFFLSGFLVAYGAFREMEKNKGRLNIVLMYIHRYLRLTPILIFTILFVVSLAKYFGNGPQWPAMIEQVVGTCETSWWGTILYVQNYAIKGQICLAHTWYLAIDFQLYVLSPLVLFPLYHLGKHFAPVLVLLSLGSIGCVIAIFYKYNISNLYLSGEDKFQRTYSPTHTRYSVYLVGVSLAYYLFSRHGKRVQMSKTVVTLGWLICFGVILTILFGTHHLKQAGVKSTILEAALYESLSRPAWGIALSWIVVACHNGYGGPINAILSYPVWQPLGRLAYTMYISHFILMPMVTGTHRTDVYFSDFEAILAFWSYFGLSICVSIVMVLAFESPIIALEKIMFGGSKKPKESPQSSSNLAEVVQVQVAPSEKPALD